MRLAYIFIFTAKIKNQHLVLPPLNQQKSHESRERHEKLCVIEVRSELRAMDVRVGSQVCRDAGITITDKRHDMLARIQLILIRCVDVVTK